jgi:23S rRNA (adenine2503-C2)-methyltransferase
LKQMQTALFQAGISDWSQITTLPRAMKHALASIPWISHRASKIVESKDEDTFKAVLETLDHQCFETVLMQNSRGSWTICVSSQIGCAMRCLFCATGTMGLIRSLTSDEIVDQYRFWQDFLRNSFETTQRISNVVFMGMGEPLTNYENVKEALMTLLTYTDVGPTHIVVSTVGVIPQLNKLLTDKDWPHVRIAILHSANAAERMKIVPTSFPEFLDQLAAWTHEYARVMGNKRTYVTFEYTVLAGINDSPERAEELARYMKKTAARKINLIPLNAVAGKPFTRTERSRMDTFKDILSSHDITVTERRSMGTDIGAACGQLVSAQI